MDDIFSPRPSALRKALVAATASIAIVASIIAGLAPPLITSALAQTTAPNASQADKVAITGVKLTSNVIENFVEASAAPSLYVGKMPRWKADICPSVAGAGSGSAALIIQRIRAIAAMAGAPVAPPACLANVEVNFAGAPQVLLDEMLKDQPELVGYAKSPDQARRLATVSQPIQAWYAAQWEDNNGLVHPEVAQETCGGTSVADVTSSCGVSSTGLRARASDNRKSEFLHVLIVVDTSKIAGLSLDAVADDVAMLALAQPKSFETCQVVPSITNLLLPNCKAETKTTALTDIDLAYLRGVYKMKPDRTFSQQEDEIEDEMAKARAP